jgi:hypothetical protein
MKILQYVLCCTLFTSSSVYLRERGVVKGSSQYSLHPANPLDIPHFNACTAANHNLQTPLTALHDASYMRTAFNPTLHPTNLGYLTYRVPGLQPNMACPHAHAHAHANPIPSNPSITPAPITRCARKSPEPQNPPMLIHPIIDPSWGRDHDCRRDAS